VAPVVRVGAALASLGALLALLSGIGRTALAMARNRDLPPALDAVHPQHRVPHRAQVAVGLVVAVLAAAVDVRGAIGFSSFGVLVYYTIANASAFTQPAPARRRPRAMNVVGAVGCLLLVGSLPTSSIVAGAAMFAVGLAGRAVVTARRRGRPARRTR